MNWFKSFESCLFTRTHHAYQKVANYRNVWFRSADTPEIKWKDFFHFSDTECMLNREYSLFFFYSLGLTPRGYVLTKSNDFRLRFFIFHSTFHDPTLWTFSKNLRSPCYEFFGGRRSEASRHRKNHNKFNPKYFSQGLRRGIIRNPAISSLSKCLCSRWYLQPSPIVGETFDSHAAEAPRVAFYWYFINCCGVVISLRSRLSRAHKCFMRSFSLSHIIRPFNSLYCLDWNIIYSIKWSFPSFESWSNASREWFGAGKKI